MANSVTKSELVQRVARETGLKRADAEAAVAAFLGGVEAALSAGDRVTLVGFGTFSAEVRPERTGKHPRTGEPLQIRSARSVKFKASPVLRSSVNREP